MATLSTWVDRTRSHLMSGRSEERNTLSVSYTAGSGSLTLTSPLGGVVAGGRISIGLNTFYVSAIPESGTTITVIGGQEGTTDANAAGGALVRVGPRFTDADVVDALTTDLADLSAPDNGLFQMKSLDLTYANFTTGYDVAAADMIDLYEVRAQASGTAKDWVKLAKAGYDLERNADTAVFPSGLALMLRQPGANGLKVRLLYRAGFVAPLLLATDLATTGLPLTAYDIPPMGAAMRLVSTREVKRNFTETQGDTRRAGEVQAGAVTQSMRPLAALRMARIQAEAARLMAQYADRKW